MTKILLVALTLFSSNAFAAGYCAATTSGYEPYCAALSDKFTCDSQAHCKWKESRPEDFQSSEESEIQFLTPEQEF